MAGQPGIAKRLWFRWRQLQLPWRRQRLMGYDLEGNTYWEFKDALNSNRNRRIVKYGNKTHYGDVKVPPVWMQWLRQTRYDAPTVADQRAEVFRQSRMKQLAAEADARWAAKPSALDAPEKQQPVQMLTSKDQKAGVTQTNAGEAAQEEVGPQSGSTVDATSTKQAPADLTDQASSISPTAPKEKKEKRSKSEPQDSPWANAPRGNPGDEWQPQGWAPAPARRRG